MSSDEQQARILRVLTALDEKPINQQQANNMTVTLLTEIASTLERIEKKIDSAAQK
jgi:hypothetical protein